MVVISSHIFLYFGEKITRFLATNIRKILMRWRGWEYTKNLFTEEFLSKVSRFLRRHILQPINFNVQHNWTRKFWKNFTQKYLLCKTERTSKDLLENSFQKIHALCPIFSVKFIGGFPSFIFMFMSIQHNLRCKIVVLLWNILVLLVSSFLQSP